MKTQTPAKLKFARLKQRLKLPHFQIVGVLESLWLTTYVNAPDGNIGRLSNEEIAAAIEYDGDPDELVAALVATGWLDAHERFRLIVHDWSEHCANHHRGAYAKHGKLFSDQVAAQETKATPEQPAKQAARNGAKHAARNGATKPAIPNQTKPTSQPAEQQAGGLAGDDGWEAIGSRLAGLQVACWRESVAEAKACGCSPGLAAELIDFAQRNGYGPGAIAYRFKRASPALKVADGWPLPESRDDTAAKAAAQRAEKRRQEEDHGLAVAIVRRGREAKRTEEQIRSELAAAGLAWP